MVILGKIFNWLLIKEKKIIQFYFNLFSQFYSTLIYFVLFYFMVSEMKVTKFTIRIGVFSVHAYKTVKNLWHEFTLNQPRGLIKNSLIEF